MIERRGIRKGNEEGQSEKMAGVTLKTLQPSYPHCLFPHSFPLHLLHGCEQLLISMLADVVAQASPAWFGKEQSFRPAD